MATGKGDRGVRGQDRLPSIIGTTEGAFLNVRVAPGASRSKIVGVFGDALKVAVRAPPEKGRANKELVRVLARAFGARRGDVEVRFGQASRDKTVVFAGWPAEDLRQAITAELAPASE